MILDPSKRTFPPFDLARLLKTVFQPEGGERIAILIDLEDPKDISGFRFLRDANLDIQRKAHNVFYEGLQSEALRGLGLKGGEMFAYQVTLGSNLDLPDEAFTPAGDTISLEQDVYPNYDLILCISTFSATAPLTAFAKKYGFRGATLHGVNDIILASGLAVDYEDVSKDAEKLRLGMTRADRFEIDFQVAGRAMTLEILCNAQEAQKSHGLCRGSKPDVANLPAGEVYFVPEGADGQFPMLYPDGTLGAMEVSDGRIQNAALITGNQAVIDAHNAKISADPVTGEIGELGLGTQVLPWSGRDIQDEKVLGTVHVATGRSDHLGGKLTPDLFAEHQNATHDDILFAPHKTPGINVPEMRMHRNGETTVVLADYQPSAYLVGLLEG